MWRSGSLGEGFISNKVSKTLLFCEQKRSKKNFVNLDRAVEIASG
jgi:hypothetical protein